MLPQTLVVGLSDLSRADAVAALVGGTVTERLPALKAALIALNGPRPDPQAAALALTGQAGVTYASAQTVLTRDPVEGARAMGLLGQSVDQRIDALPQYALDAHHLNAQAAWNAGLRGAGVTVGVIDAPADLSHPDLQGRWAGRAFDPVSNTEYSNPADWTAAVSRMNGGDLSGLDGGTAAASAAVAAQNGSGLVGAAPDARFLTAAVFQPTFIGSFGAARAVVWCVDAGARVIDLPWSSLGYDPLLKAATDYALSRRVTVVAAAGNSGRQERQQPAMYPGVLASAAGDLSGGLASFSSFGADPFPLAPGLDLLLARPGWGRAAGSYALYSGTAFSSALLSGASALLLGADPVLDPYQVRALLLGASAAGPLDLGRLPAALAAPRPAAAAQAQISLRVHTLNGDVPALLGDLTLLSTDPSGPVYLARTDAQGDAAFYGVQPGTYHVLAAAPDLSVSGGQAAERGSLSADLTLPAGVVTAQTYTLDRGAVDLHPTDPYEPDDDVASAAPLSYGAQTALAYIAGKPRDLDFFAFQGQATDRIRASVAAKGDPAVGGQLDSVLVLRDPSGAIIGYDDDYTGPDARLEATLPATGRYTLEVSSFRILGPSEGADPAQGQPDDSPFNRYRLRLDRLNAP
ncbi:S8 family serine peptidase [Deinococcus sp.]|uniref:S8 family serine peptidase n=1 Tax=Deinococcus sp. TaxID=47478 RepID=UPI003C7E2C29